MRLKGREGENMSVSAGSFGLLGQSIPKVCPNHDLFIICQ